VYKEETPIKVGDVVDYLQSKGIKGKRHSVDAQVRIILKKESQRGQLQFLKGVGFFKSQRYAEKQAEGKEPNP
jgi:hypothetical protein